MQPIVNGLETEFTEQIVFERIDANTNEGQALLRTYGLRGHPSYAIVDTDGKRLWSASGQVSDAVLREQITQHMN